MENGLFSDDFPRQKPPLVDFPFPMFDDTGRGIWATYGKLFFFPIPILSEYFGIIIEFKWWFPKIGVPLNHPFVDGFSSINHPAIGVPSF